MNRRTFLHMLGLAPVAAALPKSEPVKYATGGIVKSGPALFGNYGPHNSHEAWLPITPRPEAERIARTYTRECAWPLQERACADVDLSRLFIDIDRIDAGLCTWRSIRRWGPVA